MEWYICYMAELQFYLFNTPGSKVPGANMGPTWVLSAPDGPHVGPMNLAIKDSTLSPEHSQKTLHSSVMKASYGMSSVNLYPDLCDLITIVTIYILWYKI